MNHIERVVKLLDELVLQPYAWCDDGWSSSPKPVVVYAYTTDPSDLYATVHSTMPMGFVWVNYSFLEPCIGQNPNDMDYQCRCHSMESIENVFFKTRQEAMDALVIHKISTR